MQINEYLTSDHESFICLLETKTHLLFFAHLIFQLNKSTGKIKKNLFRAYNRFDFSKTHGLFV